jgi:hypothetical protein
MDQASGCFKCTSQSTGKPLSGPFGLQKNTNFTASQSQSTPKSSESDEKKSSTNLTVQALNFLSFNKSAKAQKAWEMKEGHT